MQAAPESPEFGTRPQEPGIGLKEQAAAAAWAGGPAVRAALLVGTEGGEERGALTVLDLWYNP